CAEQVGQLGGARHGSWVVNRQGGGEWARVPAKDSDEGIEGPVWPEQGEKVGRGPIRARGGAKKRQRPGGSRRPRTCRHLTQQPRQDSRKSRENSQATSRSVGCYLAKPGAPRKSALKADETLYISAHGDNDVVEHLEPDELAEVLIAAGLTDKV